MPSTDILAAQFNVWMTLSGDDLPSSLDGKRIDVSRIELRFGKNGIPQAVINVPAGINIFDRSASKVYELIKNSNSTIQVTLWFKADGDQTATKRWSRSARRIWRGYLSGFTYTKQRGRTTYMLSSAHWIRKLDDASMALEAIFKGSVDNLSGFVTYGGTGITGDSFAHEAATDDSPLDLKTSILQPILKKLMLSTDDDGGANEKAATYTNFVNRIQQSTSVRAQNADLSTHPGNKPAYDLLFGSGSPHFDDETGIYMLGNSNILLGDLDATKDSFLKQNFAKYIANWLINNAGSTSLFDKLVSIGQVLNFDLVPTVESASLVPRGHVFLNNTQWRTLDSNSYYAAQGQAIFPRDLAGVAFIGTTSLTTFASTGEESIDQNNLPAAAFLGLDTGFISLRMTPAWMKYATELSLLDDAPETPEIGDAYYNLTTSYAKQVWADEHYKFRQVTIRTPLRFDISPGSGLKLLGLNVPLGTSDTYASLYGSVQSTTIVLDVESKEATTVLSISHLRGDSDEDDGLVPDAPALYGTHWPGSFLVAWDDDDRTPQGSAAATGSGTEAGSEDGNLSLEQTTDGYMAVRGAYA